MDWLRQRKIGRKAGAVMTAKEYLLQAHRIDLRIAAKLEQVQSLHDLATKASATVSITPPSGTRNVHSMESAIINMVELKNELNDDIKNLVELKRDIVATIGSVAVNEHRILLELRYVCGRTWEDIGTEMRYSVRNIHVIHGLALRAVGKILEKRT